MTDGENRWRGTSPEERADDRRDRLIAACLDIVGEHGAAGLGVRAVCRTANVSHRYFYEWFADTDALLRETYERAVRRLLQEVASALAVHSGSGLDLRDQLHLSFEAATAYLERNPVAGRVIFQEALASEALRQHAAPALPAFLHAVHAMTAGTRQQGPPTVLQTALISGGLAAVFIEWLSGTEQFTRMELVDYCTDAVLAILSADSSPADS